MGKKESAKRKKPHPKRNENSDCGNDPIDFDPMDFTNLEPNDKWPQLRYDDPSLKKGNG